MYFLLYHDKGSLLKMNTAINVFNLLKFNIHRITVLKNRDTPCNNSCRKAAALYSRTETFIKLVSLKQKLPLTALFPKFPQFCQLHPVFSTSYCKQI